MEFHEGAKTLAEVIYTSCNPFHGDALRCLDLFEQIVSAIGACEECESPIVHRDIKPDNILVLKDGTIRLIDFGICHFDDGNMITLTDEGVGARNYTAPECESGSVDRPIGTFSDIYSAAKVLWSSITSQSAFAREQPVFRHRSMNEVFPLQSETWHLTRIFKVTIREDPEHRCKTTRPVRGLIRELRYLIQGGFPPLEDIANRCPSCGNRGLVDFPDAPQVFGNPLPIERVWAHMCKSCGFAFVRNHKILRKKLDDVEDLS